MERISEQAYRQASRRDSRRNALDFYCYKTAIGAFLSWIPVGAVAQVINPNLVAPVILTEVGIFTASLSIIGIDAISGSADRRTLEQWRAENPEPDGYAGWM